MKSPLIHPRSSAIVTAAAAIVLAPGARPGQTAAPAAPADNLCNDFTLGPDHALYVSDTLASRICRLRPGAREGELLI